MKGASKYGILEGEQAGFDLGKIISRKDKVVKKLTGGVKMKLTSSGVEIVEGVATLLGEKSDKIRISCNEVEYVVKYVLVCTGSDTIIPPVKGLADVAYWTSKEALEIKELPKSLVIIGGGVIGIEFASFFNSMGVKVTVIEMMPEILGAMDKETSAMLRKEYAKKGIDFHLNTKVTEVSPEGVTIEKDSKTSIINADRILLSVGRRANADKVGLSNLSVEILRNGE